MVAERARRRIGAATIYLLGAGAYGIYSRMIFTVIAVYYIVVVRVNPLQLILIGTVLEVAEFVWEVPTGMLADTYGRRFAVIAGTFLFGFSYVFQGLMPLFAAILALEAIRGIGNACISGALAAWIAQEVGEGRVGRVFARGAQVRQAGGLVGIGLSVGLASIRLDLPILIGGGLGVALSLFLLIFMPEHHSYRRAPRGSGSLHAMRHTLRDALRCVRGRPVLVVLLVVAACYGASSEGIDRLWEAHLLAGFTFPPLGAHKPVVWFGII
jgi:MFS family permease